MAIHITDPETVALVRRLAKALPAGITSAIRHAVLADLEVLGESTEIEAPKPRGLKAQFMARVYQDLLEYGRLCRAAGKRPDGRVFAMLNRYKNDPAEFVRRLFRGSRNGLLFLYKCDRKEIAMETTVLDPVFASLFSKEIKAQARENLAWAEASVGKQTAAQ